MPEAAPSYAHGTSSIALIGETIGRHFDRTVARWGDRPGLIACQQGVRWSYRELGEKVDAFAAGLIALGLKPGERIGIWSPNNAEWVVTQFATAKAGLILVNINPAYRLAGVGICAEQGRLPRADHRDIVQDQRLCRDDQHAGAGTAARASRPSGRGEAAVAAHRHPDRRGYGAGRDPVRQRVHDWAAPRSRRA